MGKELMLDELDKVIAGVTINNPDEQKSFLEQQRETIVNLGLMDDIPVEITSIGSATGELAEEELDKVIAGTVINDSKKQEIFIKQQRETIADLKLMDDDLIEAPKQR